MNYLQPLDVNKDKKGITIKNIFRDLVLIEGR